MKLWIAVLGVVVVTGVGACKADDPPDDATVFLDVNRTTVDPDVNSLKFTIERLALFYGEGPKLPDNAHECGFDGADVISFGSNVELDLTSVGVENIGQFFARPGPLHEVRMLLKRPSAVVQGVEHRVFGFSCVEPDLKHDGSGAYGHEFVLARLVPSGGAILELPARGIVRLRMNVDPISDLQVPPGVLHANMNAKGPARLDRDFELEMRVVSGGGATLESTMGIVPDEAVVLFRRGTSLARVDELFTAGGFAVRRGAPANLYFTVGVPSGSNLVQTIDYLLRIPEIEVVLPNTIPLNRRQPNEWASGPFMWAASMQATAAWDTTVGNSKAVVGVVEKGFDPDHLDLFLNIHINEGELPSEFTTRVSGRKVTDCDEDDVISFYDLNCVGCTLAEAPRNATDTCTANVEAARAAACTRDSRVCIPMVSPFLPSTLAGALMDGDSDGNRFPDDIVGWDFVDNDNNPSTGTTTTMSGTVIAAHGMEITGMIGAVGNNLLDVAGVAWRVGIIPLRAGFRDQAVLAFDYGARSGAHAINYSQGLVFAAGKWPVQADGSNFRYNGPDCIEYSMPNNQDLGASRISGKLAQHDKELDRIPLDKTILTVAPTDCGFDLDKKDEILDWPSQSANPSVICAAPSSGQNPKGSFILRTPSGPGAVLVAGGGASSASALESTSYAAPFVAGTAALSVAHCPTVLGPNLKTRIFAAGSFLNARGIVEAQCPP